MNAIATSDTAGVRTRRRPGTWLAVLALLWAVAMPAVAQTRAWLDRDRIALGETATLNIETDQAAVDAPDYSPLRGDFRLSGNTSSRQYENVNGTARARVLFAVALQPVRQGAFVIPRLLVGAQRTQPLMLRVGPSQDAPPRAGGTVFIQAEADAKSPYVQQAIGYVVKLYYATSLISGQLDQDAPEGASLQRVGEDLQYQREIAGRRYTVVERRYLLIPERSGVLSVPGARFRGQGVGGFFDDLFGDGRRELRAAGASATLTVRAAPADAPQPWLPLRGLSVRYLSAPQTARAGEAAGVTVEMVADGASGTQLPELQMSAGDAAQVFADAPVVEESFAKGRPQVRVVRKFSVVPARAGALRVTGPRIGWWDASAGIARTAAAPDLQLQVAAGVASTAAMAAAPAAHDAQGWVEVPWVQGAVRPWALAALAFALLWLVTLWWALHRRPQQVSAGASQGASPSRAAPAIAKPVPVDLKRALDTGDLDVIASALCASAAPAAADLDAVRTRLDDAAQRAAVDALQAARWGTGDASAARGALRAAFRSGPRWRAVAKAGKPLLPPLYPEA